MVQALTQSDVVDLRLNRAAHYLTAPEPVDPASRPEDLNPLVPPTSAAVVPLPSPAESPPPLSEVEELVQKFGVKLQVAEFLQRGMEGVWCAYFRERDNEWVTALYSVSAGAKYFVLLTGEQLEVQELVIPFSAVREVHSIYTDDVEEFPESVMKELSPDDSDRFVMVAFERNDSLMRFCLLEQSSLARSNFVDSMLAVAGYARRFMSTISRDLDASALHKAAEIVLKLPPGKLGAALDARTGEVLRVESDGLAARAQVKPGMVFLKVNGKAFTRDLLAHHSNGSVAYELVAKRKA
jgi:hypothetical protein